MDSQEFVDIRKKLDKTQKELAALMGISLKAVCSYEQGWRSIPGHAQRQLIFLLAKKFSMSGQPANCWDIRQCPEEKVRQCPAWEFKAGNLCWFIGGTKCGDTVHVSWEKKMETCKKCPVMQDVPL